MSKEYIGREEVILAVRHAWAKGLEPTQYIEQIPAADVLPVVHGELTEHIHELLRAEKDGRLVVLPCRVGDRIYRVIDDCTFPGDCGTERMCKGCEYRNLFIEKTTFHMYLLTDEWELRRGYYRTREEAEKALKGNAERTENK